MALITQDDNTGSAASRNSGRGIPEYFFRIPITNLLPNRLDSSTAIANATGLAVND